MRLTFLTAIFLLLALSVGAQEASKRLSVVADEWPPFSGAELPEQGISLHVISSVLREAGYDVETRVLPWARIMDGAERGEFDIIGSLFFDPELTQYLTYSAPYYQTDVRFVRRVGSALSFSTVRNLKGLKIAVGDGFLYQDEFDRATYLDKIVVTTTLQALQMVAFERADLTVDSVDVVNYSTNSLDKSLDGQLEFAPGVLATQPIHMAVRNNLPMRDEVIADFNATLEKMNRDGTLDQLLQVHVPQ